MGKIKLAKSAVDTAQPKLHSASMVECEAEGVWRIPGDLAERGRQYDAQRLDSGLAVELKSHLSIERQARVVAAPGLPSS